MSNLLPEKEQQKIRNEYRARFILTGSYMAIGAAFFTALAILPSFSVLLISRPAALEQATRAQQGQTDSADIAKTQFLLSQISSVVAATSTPTVAILQALATKPSGVHIDNIVYDNGTAPTLALGGTADNRALADKYRTLLQANSIFSSVKLPVGDLLGTESGRFTITLTGKF